MKAKQLGNVVFLYPQEVIRECSVAGDKRRSAAGTDIAFSARVYTPEITLVSAEDDWMDAQNIADISLMCEQIGTIYTLVYEDDSTEEVRFDHSRKTSFSEIMTGTCFYYGNISLAKT